MNKLRKVGIVVAAAMVLAALTGLGSASAATRFTAGKVGAAIEEITLQKHIFTITGASVECNASFTGVTEGLDTVAQMVTPRYEECGGPGPVEVKTENCTYNLTVNGEVHLEPTTGTSCQITFRLSSIFGECHFELTGPQTLGGVSYSNNGASAINVTINSTGISDHVTKSTGVCPLTVGTHTNATYTAQSMVSAKGTTIQVD